MARHVGIILTLEQDPLHKAGSAGRNMLFCARVGVYEKGGTYFASPEIRRLYDGGKMNIGDYIGEIGYSVSEKTSEGGRPSKLIDLWWYYPIDNAEHGESMRKTGTASRIELHCLKILQKKGFGKYIIQLSKPYGVSDFRKEQVYARGHSEEQGRVRVQLDEAVRTLQTYLKKKHREKTPPKPPGATQGKTKKRPGLFSRGYVKVRNYFARKF